MVDRVLVPMDDSAEARHALRYALDVHTDAEITVLHVAGGASGMMGEAAALSLADDVDEAVKETAREIFHDAREMAADYDIEIATKIQLGSPSHAILQHAEEYDTIVLGYHDSTLSERLLTGNVAEKVFRQSPVPVTVVR